jgi:RNase P protein component
MKDILMKNNFNSSSDYVIILRNGVLSLSYNEMKDEIINILKGEK